jgi:membrane associated rhomboid family serine protease
MSFFDDLKYKLAQNNAVVKLIALNVAVYLVFAIAYVFFALFKADSILASVQNLFYLYALPSRFISQPWGLFTYMFFHEGFFHLLFNMLWLYLFGMLLQEYLGNKRVYQTYIMGGIFGGILYILSYNFFPLFEEVLPFSSALGASAGVLAIVVAAATLLPHYTIMLFGIFAIQLRYIALFSVLIDFLSIPSSNAGGRIAHLGGALAGFLFIKYLKTNNAFTNAIHSVSSFFGNIFKPKSKLTIHYKAESKPKASATKSHKPNQADVDAILDKISRSGYSSLTQSEKDILAKASQED